ncbi:MAG: flavodoxin family protein [Clostridiales bacterium]|nr:flavodoxin family protein [Clostridiales bacterium]
MKTLIIYKSIHLGNTKKIAETIAKVLDADLLQPGQLDADKIAEYDLIGFGSGIYSDTYHPTILKLIDGTHHLNSKRVFIFSTAGVIYKKSHIEIKQKLRAKNTIFMDEFYCKGLNKNSFLKFFGGMNKGRPNADDLKRALNFANALQNSL